MRFMKEVGHDHLITHAPTLDPEISSEESSPGPHQSLSYLLPLRVQFLSQGRHPRVTKVVVNFVLIPQSGLLGN